MVRRKPVLIKIDLMYSAEYTPIITLRAHENSIQVVLADLPIQHAYHFVVLLGRTQNGNLIVKNSLAGSHVFGTIQPSEHEVEFTIKKDPPNQWNLADMYCWFIELD